jgi:hypothetical protein
MRLRLDEPIAIGAHLEAAIDQRGARASWGDPPL